MSPVTETKPRTPRPKKLRKDLGPFATEVVVFDAGNRKLDVTITPTGVRVHAARSANHFFVPWGVVFDRGVSIAAGAQTTPRTGGIKRQIGGAP